MSKLFRRTYTDIYYGSLYRLYQSPSESPLLIDELEYLYSTFIQKWWIADNPKIQYVFSLLRNEVISPEKTPEGISESAKLFYVAMTRAKKRLHITYAESVS